MGHFGDRVVQAVREAGNAVMVGLDPRSESLPPGFLPSGSVDRAGVARAFAAFGCEVVEVVAGRVPAVKFQAACYEAYGSEGMQALHETAELARGRGLVVVIDGKRNDIGSTAEAYARAYVGRSAVGDRMEPIWPADAVTVNAYLGSDGVRPFINEAAREGRGLFVLVRTSNPSAREFQDLISDGRPLYRHVAERLAEWAAPHRGESGYSFVGAVVGATYPDELRVLREALPGVLFLVPGYGAQGGTARDVAHAFDAQGLGAFVNSSRGLTFAYERADLRAKFAGNWQGAIVHAVDEMVADLARNTPAGRLQKA